MAGMGRATRRAKPLLMRDAWPLVVVTGGAGFIGSHVVDHLHRARAPRRRARQLLDRQAREPRAHGADAPLDVVTCDVVARRSSPRSRRSPREHGAIERIVHLAAQVSVVASIANPLVDMEVNYGGTLHVLEYARATGVNKVVFASSAAVYGDVAELPGGGGRALRAGVAVRHRQARLRARARLLRERARRADDRAALLQRLRSAPGSVEPVLGRDLDLRGPRARRSRRS